VDPGQLFIVLAMFGLMLLVLNRGRRQQREMQAVQSRIAVGAEVMTTSGMYATVVALEGDVVTLEMTPGQRSRWDRRAVARILEPGIAASEEQGVASDSVALESTEHDPSRTSAVDRGAAGTQAPLDPD
jgi:preprotein translocase subunit YajC